MIAISLYMVVKNEEAILERLLKIVFNVADQIVVVGTGPTNRTRRTTARYTDEIHDFPWTGGFVAARDVICQGAVMDYWTWMNADDVMGPEQVTCLMKLKENLDPSVDMAMMRHLTDFDENRRTSFSYYREYLLGNHEGFQWQGRVHEAVTPAGNILYTDTETQHRKEAAGDEDRNLKIYETMLNQGGLLEPRHQFYCAKELYYHGHYEDAIRASRAFLQGPRGWVENRMDAYFHPTLYEEHLGHTEEATEASLKNFLYDTPRDEACCELGRMKMMDEKYKEAAYWYARASSFQPAEQTGTLVRKDCYGFLPATQLCVCYDHLGDYRRAWRYYLKSQGLKPEYLSVRQNQTYFEHILKHLTEGQSSAQ